MENKENVKENVIAGVKFKLYFDNEKDKEEMEDFFSEYAKCVTFAAKIIYQLRKPFKFVGLSTEFAKKIWNKTKDIKIFEERLQKYGINSTLIQKSIDLIKENSKEKWIFTADNCDYCNEKKEIYYKNINNNKLVCKECYNKDYSDSQIEKKLVPVEEGRGRPPKYPRTERVSSKINIHNVGKISPTHYHYAAGDALELLEALKQQRREKIKRLLRNKNDLRQFQEMFNNPEKRFPLPLIGKQREIRYIHISKKERANELRGYRIKQIRDKIRILIRNIERDEKSLRRHSPLKFKGTRIKLSPSISFDKSSNKVKLTLWKQKIYGFSGTNVANQHGKTYFENILDKIENQKPNYAYLIRKKIDEEKIDNKKIPIYDYYLQYTVEIPVTIKENYDSVIGIDRGITKIATLVLIQKENPKKPMFVKFYRGEPIIALKFRRRKQNYFLKGTHNKKRKIKRIRPIEPIIEQKLHIISKDIVETAKKNNSVICIEALEKIKKGKFKQRKREKYYLSLFTFRRLSDFITYKAKREGIKVISVPAEGTSYLCSHCGSKNTERPYKKPNALKPSYSLFKCNDCGIELNSDFNAAFNIAQKGLNNLNI